MSTRRKVLGDFAGRKAAFLFTFSTIFVIFFLTTWYLDLLPNAPTTHSEVPVVVSPSNMSGEAPVRIVINTINLSAYISNPSTDSVEVLDKALLIGAVRYPNSAPLGVKGTVLLFGHSSYLPVVHNKAYKAFDDIQNLLKGESISVYSSTKEYRYKVTSTRKANVNDPSTNTVKLATDAQHLVLVTCDSFASKSDRFVVTANLSGVYEIGQ